VEVTMKMDQMKEGKQIWSWGGKLSIYFDLNVVFIHKKEGWEAVSLEELSTLGL